MSSNPNTGPSSSNRKVLEASILDAPIPFASITTNNSSFVTWPARSNGSSVYTSGSSPTPSVDLPSSSQLFAPQNSKSPGLGMSPMQTGKVVMQRDSSPDRTSTYNILSQPLHSPSIASNISLDDYSSGRYDTGGNSAFNPNIPTFNAFGMTGNQQFSTQGRASPPSVVKPPIGSFVPMPSSHPHSGSFLPTSSPIVNQSLNAAMPQSRSPVQPLPFANFPPTSNPIVNQSIGSNTSQSRSPSPSLAQIPFANFPPTSTSSILANQGKDFNTLSPRSPILSLDQPHFAMFPPVSTTVDINALSTAQTSQASIPLSMSALSPKPPFIATFNQPFYIQSPPAPLATQPGSPKNGVGIQIMQPELQQQPSALSSCFSTQSKAKPLSDTLTQPAAPSSATQQSSISNAWAQFPPPIPFTLHYSGLTSLSAVTYKATSPVTSDFPRSLLVGSEPMISMEDTVTKLEDQNGQSSTSMGDFVGAEEGAISSETAPAIQKGDSEFDAFVSGSPEPPEPAVDLSAIKPQVRSSQLSPRIIHEPFSTVSFTDSIDEHPPKQEIKNSHEFLSTQAAKSNNSPNKMVSSNVLKSEEDSHFEVHSLGEQSIQQQNVENHIDVIPFSNVLSNNDDSQVTYSHPAHNKSTDDGKTNAYRPLTNTQQDHKLELASPVSTIVNEFNIAEAPINLEISLEPIHTGVLPDLSNTEGTSSSFENVPDYPFVIDSSIVEAVLTEESRGSNQAREKYNYPISSSVIEELSRSDGAQPFMLDPSLNLKEGLDANSSLLYETAPIPLALSDVQISEPNQYNNDRKDFLSAIAINETISNVAEILEKGPVKIQETLTASSDIVAVPESVDQSQTPTITNILLREPPPRSPFPINTTIPLSDPRSNQLPTRRWIAPSIFHDIPQFDQVGELINKVFTTPETRPTRRLLKIEDLPDNLSAFGELLGSGSFRAAAMLARKKILLTSPTEINQLGLLWLVRLSSLARLRLYDLVEKEVEALKLDSVEFRYERYPDLFPELEGCMVPFSLRVFAARVPALQGQHIQSIDALYRLCRECRQEGRLLMSRKRCHGNHHNLGSSGIQKNCDIEKSYLEVWRSRHVQLRLLQVSHLMALGDLPEATNLLKAIAADYLEEADLLSAMGRIYLTLGSISLAREVFARAETICGASAVTANPSTASSYGFRPSLVLMSRALLAMAEGNFSAAASHLTELITLEPAHPLAVNNLTVCLLYMGNVSQAISFLESMAIERPTIAGACEALCFNLVTLYDLADSSTTRKLRLLGTVIAVGSGDSFNTDQLKIV